MSVMAEATTIRPFKVEVPEEQLADLRRRIDATRWPSEQLVADFGSSAQAAKLIRRAALRKRPVEGILVRV